MSVSKNEVIGIYIDHLNVPCMEHIYRLAEKIGVVVFVNNYGAVDTSSRLSIMSSYFIWSFDGPIIAGDIICARYLSECPIPSKRYFYINNVDWNSGLGALDTLQAASLDLITEPELEELVTSVWKKPSIIRNWNYEQLQQLLNQ